MLNTKIELFFNIQLLLFFFFQGICSECRIALGEHVVVDCQDPKLIALPDSINAPFFGNY